MSLHNPQKIHSQLWLWCSDMDQGNRKKVEQIVEMVSHSQISSIMSIVQGIIRVINDPESNAKDLKEIIEVDPPLTGKVLRVANSTYYAPRRKIGGIMQAIVYIGFEALTEIALSQQMNNIFTKGDDYEGYSRVSLWKHSVAVALYGKMIYRKEFGEKGDTAYTAGLLHGIGIIAEDQFLEEDFRNALLKSKDENKNLPIAENEVLGYDHAKIGMEIARNWNLPLELVEAIGYHHEPDKASPSHARLVATIYVADCYCQRNNIGFSDAPSEDEALFDNCLRTLAVEPHVLDLILGDVEKHISEMEEQGLV